jgi:diguanylate cyclase (GGDEF)-like protein
MKMLCSSPSVPQLKPELLIDITQALHAHGSRLFILAKPRARILSYALQPHLDTPIEKNPLWQNILSDLDRDLHTASPTAIAPLPLRVYPIDCVTKELALAPLFDAFAAVDIQSVLILPLRYNHHCVGCLTLFRSSLSPVQGMGWTDDELQLAQSLAIHMYLAVMKERVDRMSHDRAYHDLLTGLPNRLLLSQWLTLSLARMPSIGEFLAVVFLDLDRFRNINNGLGHRCGDRLLQLVAIRLKDKFGKEATIGRWSGDEFALLIPGLNDINAVNEVADRVLNCFDLPFIFDRDLPALKTNLLSIDAKMGIAIASGSGNDSETLLQQADAALDRAKQDRTHNYEIYNNISTQRATDRLQLEKTIERAIEDRQLLLHYQPQIDIWTGKIIGIEALLRCQDLSAKLIAPADFIPIAEETGSIIQMGEWVIRTACRQNKLWQDRGFGHFPIAVNFSVKQLQDRNLLDTIFGILAETGLDPVNLEVEITESIAIKDLDLTIAILESLREIGVKISLDDFGTGYSSLAALKYLPIDRLKIDRSFIQELRANTVDAGIVRTIVNLGHELNLDVVAEGVETVEQFEFLRSINCDIVQGFLFSRPLPAIEVEPIVSQGSCWHQNLFHPLDSRSGKSSI